MPHLSLDVATMVLAGELPPRVLVRILYDHIKELCPECRQALETVQGMRGRAAAGPPRAAEPAAGPEQYMAAIDDAGQRLGPRLRAAEEERRRARRDLATLRSLPEGERERRIAAARTRFRSRALAELLVEASRETARRDPAEALALADLVPRVLGRLCDPGGRRAALSLEVLALAHRANAQRLAGDLRGADGSFAATRERLAAATLDDPALHVEVCSLEASLRRDQRRFDEAEHLLDRAILLGRLGADERAVAKALIQQADVLVERQDLEAAVDGLREALSLLDEEADRHLFACAIGTLALVECERSSYAAAEALLRRHRDLLVGDGAAWSMVRVLLLEGRIAHGLGRLADAESHFVAAHRLCLDEVWEYDAAMVALELAVLYTEQGRFAEVRRIAQRIQPAFASREVHREATAALVLFQRAVAAERITVEAMRSVRDVLCRGARDGLAPADQQPS